MAPSQTFHDHIKELRRRIMWIVLAIGITAGISYALRVSLIRILQKPLGATLFYTSPAGSFNFIIKLSTIIGLFVALPVIIYQLLRFIEPALPINIKRSTMFKLISASFLLALGGIAFGYFYMVPMSLHFFAGYSTDQIKPLISANEYLSYLMGNLTIFALMFQIPLVVLFINWIKPTRPRKLLRYQRHVIVGSFALAVVLPFTYDPISQFIVAIPIIVLFYLSVILLWAANRGRIYPGEASPAVSPILPTPPAPYTEPMLVPVLTPTINNRPRSIAVEGFVSRPVGALPRRTQYANSTELRQQVAGQPKPSHKSSPKPRLSIDGISPPLTSSA